MSWLYERKRERNFWFFCARAHKSEKKLHYRSRSPPDERALGATLKWAALTKALIIRDLYHDPLYIRTAFVSRLF